MENAMILRQNRNFGDRFQVKTFFFFFREHPDFGTKIGIFSRLRPANSNNFEKWPTRVQKLDHPALEERYAIKFCFKLGKTATETYGMLQTAYGPSCMNRSSVFQWHKRFKEGRESLRDDERCGRSREVRTSEMIGQINDFMNRDRRVSIETLSAQFNVSVGAVHKIIREELKIRKICAKFVPRVLREDQRERRCNDNKGDGRAH